MTTTLPLDRPPAPTPPLPPPPSRGLVVRVARWSATHKWLALVLWLAFVAAAIVGGGAVGTKEVEDGEGGVGASAGADKAIMQADFDDPFTESVLVQAADGGPVDTGADAVTTLTANLAAAPGVAGVAEPEVSEDGTAALYEVTLDVPEGTDTEEEDAASAAAGEIAQVVDGADGALVVGQVGDASLGDALDQVYEDDLQRAEYLSLPVSLLIMLVVFGALIAAAVPVLLALSSVVAAMGLSAFASYVVPSTDILASVVLLVGMAVGVDYSLFYVRREREEREKGRGTMDAVAVAAATSGRAVVVSGLAVIIAMAGMFFAGEATFQSLAVGTILVVAVAVIGSVTALPALLAIFGRWIDRPRIPLLWRLRRRDGGEPRVWRAILGPVLRHPKTALVAGLLALLALAAPALGMKLSQPGVSDLSKDVPEVQTYDAITTAFPAEGAAHDIGIWTSDGSPLDQAAVDSAVAQVNEAVAVDPEFAPGEGLVAEYSTDGSVAQIDVPVPYEHDDERAENSLQTLRDDLVPAAFDGMDGVESGVTGMTAGNVDFRDLLADRMPIVIGFVLLMTIVVLVMAFRSLAVALTAAGLNLLSVAASYGLLTLVFQNSWAEGLLGFESTGAIITWLPLFLFVILFGLSMDYHVFVVSRIREGAKAGQSTPEAVRSGIIRSAGVVTSAAVVMVAVFSIFATLGAIDFKQMGVGLAAAILIDATIVRAVLLPSIMVLLGERNWWLPKPLQRLPQLEH